MFAGTSIGLLLAARQQLPNVTDLLKLDDIRENYTFHQMVKTDGKPLAPADEKRSRTESGN